MAKRNEPSTTDVTTVDTQSAGPGQEVAPNDRFAPEALRDIKTFEDAARLLYMAGIETVEAGQVLGDGFALLKDEGKARLVGVPILLLEWDFYPGDFGDTFVAIRLVARNPDGTAGKYIINDGSTGIAKMLKDYTNRTGMAAGLVVRNGLRPSSYTFCEACARPLAAGEADDEHREAGKHKKATTYYLDTSL
jgi:hypothetical protein